MPTATPFTITGISKADNDKDFSVYEITQYDNNAASLSGDGTVNLSDGLNHAVYLKGLIPGQTGTVAKTGLYGVNLVKTLVPANSGAVEVVIATGAIMTGVPLLTTGATFGSPLAVNTDLEYQAIGTIGTTGIVFNDTRYNGTITAQSAGSLRFGAGGASTPDQFLYIQIPKTTSSFHTSVVPAPEAIEFASTTISAGNFFKVTLDKGSFLKTTTAATIVPSVTYVTGTNVSTTLSSATFPLFTLDSTGKKVIFYKLGAATPLAIGTVSTNGTTNKITAAALKESPVSVQHPLRCRLI
ncbi:hypothetical protein AGMMS50267_17840 [Spirochaetia bacterium]|nr:hypothetical protein AGMMS50267_17840 [Spirochaetia bacterium]